MPAKRRSSGTKRFLEATLGRALREARRARGWTQADLGRRIGVSQSLVSRYECATAHRPRLDLIAAAFDALGVSVRVETNAPFLVDGRRQHDRAHASVVSYVLGRLPAGWLAQTEVQVGPGRRVGWIDILAFHPPSGTLVVLEIKTELEDVGGTLRVLEWYAQEAVIRARQFGWQPRRVIHVLVGLATGEIEGRLSEARDLFARALPARADALLQLFTDPARPLLADGAAVAGGLALVDPLSRRRRWLRRARIDGRRSAAPYADYADFARAIERRRRPSRGSRWAA